MRKRALDALFSSPGRSPKLPRTDVSARFAQDVLTLQNMRTHLSGDVYSTVEDCIARGKKLNGKTADAIAVAAKGWALKKGATHYTHWFHPLSGVTAEKHTAFFDPAKRLETLGGEALIQQEPDASSFPSGGIRSTFEARGYTVWDPSSPMFVWDGNLCIPTFFISYTGESLDYKTPLLKASHALDKAATKVAKWFIRGVTSVQSLAGWEQEYFLVDRLLCQSRPDLLLTGRTLVGKASPRGQQLSDHYFGSVPSRVVRYMKALEAEAHRLGIPIKTRHNEVAPSQFEVAPHFEEANQAMDHNQLLQHVMKRVANRHRFKVLFHEKPFAGINGSGKHCNWSLRTNTGVNLMDPEGDELLFLVFFINALMAVRNHEALLRASVATYSNDLRMGGHEAPPTIVSVFIGAHLQGVLDNLLKKNWHIRLSGKTNMRFLMDASVVPAIKLDNTDRNRTSPFAFTGNRFEFRAPGASTNIARPITVLNTVLAQQLTSFHEAVTAHAAKERKVAILEVLRAYVRKASDIIFNGDGYSGDWAKMAAQRKLSNLKDTPQALKHYTTPKTIALFGDQGVMTARELRARKNVDCDNYALRVTIEANVLHEMISTQLIPAALTQQSEVASAVSRSQALGVPAKDLAYLAGLGGELAQLVQLLGQHITAMKSALHQANRAETSEKKAEACLRVREKHFAPIRTAADRLEEIVNDNLFPWTKYRELLFLR